MFHFRRFHNSFNRFGENEKGDEHQKQSVHKSGQNFSSYVTEVFDNSLIELIFFFWKLIEQITRKKIFRLVAILWSLMQLDQQAKLCSQRTCETNRI